ncbi:Uncharacterized conserved protein [Marinobacter persicus]|uniref:Uncharacterized conserved protein n=1 Tax=Marinobacter persicus TaxID=930118 RepID=A0A1I3RYA8_9GAMM|nr:DUF411 domain-containing protein [Marinobacter persicus]GHD44568.1 copper amine oxidase [Marinobacter persicus]SFJ50359.1 Uncharacterized conserved protein [Marinobacter persicus]
MKTRNKTIIAGSAALAIGAVAVGFKLQASEPATDSAVSGQTAHTITVYKSPSCSCCAGWAEHLERNGFDVNVEDTNNISEIKTKHQVPSELGSCHTGLIDGLVIEGHVPAADIVAYLENPQFNTVGLSVPGMVQGSPGMETGTKQDYQVIAFRANGQQSVFREHEDY